MSRADRRREQRRQRELRSPAPRVVIIERGTASVHSPTGEQRRRQLALALDPSGPPSQRLLRAAFPAVLHAVERHVAKGGDLRSHVVLVGSSPGIRRHVARWLPVGGDVYVSLVERTDPEFAGWLRSMPLRVDAPVIGAESLPIVVVTSDRVSSFVNVSLEAPPRGLVVN